jgi:hypothetical protein
MSTTQETKEFLTAFLSSEQERGQITAFHWFDYDSGQLGLSVKCSDGTGSVVVEFPVDPDLWAFGVDSQDATAVFDSSDSSCWLSELDPSDFRRHADRLDDLRRDAVHTLSRAMRAFCAPNEG